MGWNVLREAETERKGAETMDSSFARDETRMVSSASVDLGPMGPMEPMVRS